MKTFNLTVKTITVFLFFGMLFFSCNTNSRDDYGTLVIKLPGSGSSRAISDEFISTLSYNINCVRADDETEKVNEEGLKANPSGMTVPIPLSPGDWNVTVTVLNAAGEKIGQDGDTFTIKAGEITPAPISVNIDTSKNDIKSFILKSSVNTEYKGDIYEDDLNIIIVSLPPKTNIKSMKPEVVHTGRSINYPNGSILNFEDNPIYTFTVTAENENVEKKSYTVEVVSWPDDELWEEYSLSGLTQPDGTKVKNVFKDLDSLKKMGFGDIAEYLEYYDDDFLVVMLTDINDTTYAQLADQFDSDKEYTSDRYPYSKDGRSNSYRISLEGTNLAIHVHIDMDKSKKSIMLTALHRKN